MIANISYPTLFPASSEALERASEKKYLTRDPLRTRRGSLAPSGVFTFFAFSCHISLSPSFPPSIYPSTRFAEARYTRTRGEGYYMRARAYNVIGKTRVTHLPQVFRTNRAPLMCDLSLFAELGRNSARAEICITERFNAN